MSKLSCLFEPRSVAVIGASDDRTKYGNRVMQSIIDAGYTGPVYGVNPGVSTVLGRKAYPTMRELPEPVELAFIVIPSKAVLESVKDCIAAGAKGIVIITAGFGEVGAEGLVAEAEIGRLCRQAGIPAVGPNCMGVVCFSSHIIGTMTMDTLKGEPGDVSFISQSGTYGISTLNQGLVAGVGFSKFVSSGNQASIKMSDYLEYLAQDEDTKAIVLYIEGIEAEEGGRFVEIAREVAKSKPIITFKGGRTSAGSRATLSHTASLAGSDEIFDAACKQAGIIRCYEVIHPFDMAEALSCQPLPKGKRVAITGSGGQCVTTADACASLGLEIPELDQDTKRRLMEILPPWAPVPTNPVDNAAPRDPMTTPRIAEILAQLDYIDGIIISSPWSGWDSSPDRIRHPLAEAEMVTSIPTKYGKPVISTAIAGRLAAGSDLALNLYRRERIPLYDTPEESARAMYGLMRYAEIRRQLGES